MNWVMSYSTAGIGTLMKKVNVGFDWKIVLTSLERGEKKKNKIK